MTGAAFAAEWLALREPSDHRSRARPLARRFLEACADGAPLVDLGAGTGSNARYLQEMSPAPLSWRLIDADAGLVSHAGPIGAGVETVVMDLALISPKALDGAGGVSASALLDLVSEAWLRTVAELCAQARVPALFALNVDGMVRFDPEDRDDEAVLEWFARDQARDKGFGPALGPAATECANRVFSGLGFTVACARSDWVLSAGDGRLLPTYLRGVAAAAKNAGDDRVDAWLRRRLEAAKTGRLAVTVGHKDVLAVPVQP